MIMKYKHCILWMKMACAMLMGCGGEEGNIRIYEFSTSRDVVKQAVESLIATSTAFHVPPRENYTSDSGRRFYVRLNDRSGDEVYICRWLEDEEYWKNHPSNCSIGLTAIGRDDESWIGQDYLSSEEMEHATMKFEQQFLAKLPVAYTVSVYSYY
jgi:hypothetical protein